MSTLKPREPYSEQELLKLYPNELQLELVQVLLRHGERSPTASRFVHAGLRPHWPYCSIAGRMRSLVRSQPDLEAWDDLKWRRSVETFGSDNGAVLASGSKGELESICLQGELTDKGRETTLALGSRLRHLYVDQLGFMPKLIANTDMMYLRASPMPRALESLQQAFHGFYPQSARTADFPPVTIVTRNPSEEIIYDNANFCKRFMQLNTAYGQRAADRWNDTDDMAYLNKLLSKYMMPNSPKVAVDSKPRLSGMMDTINATLAHGPATRLPKDFYDPKAVGIIEKIAVDEWFGPYDDSQEFRALGMGVLCGDIVSRMVNSVEEKQSNVQGGDSNLRFAMSGCHDTTLAGVLGSLGAFKGESWPCFTSHIAFELFRQKAPSVSSLPEATGAGDKKEILGTNEGWWAKLFGNKSKPGPIARRKVEELSVEEKNRLDGYYVRIRYNDRVMQVPGCEAKGKHLEGDESFCTLEAFKAVVDKFTPRDWKMECMSNLGKPTFPSEPEPAGY